MLGEVSESRYMGMGSGFREMATFSKARFFVEARVIFLENGEDGGLGLDKKAFPAMF